MRLLIICHILALLSAVAMTMPLSSAGKLEAFQPHEPLFSSLDSGIDRRNLDDEKIKVSEYFVRSKRIAQGVLRYVNNPLHQWRTIRDLHHGMQKLRDQMRTSIGNLNDNERKADNARSLILASEMLHDVTWCTWVITVTDPHTTFSAERGEAARVLGSYVTPIRAETYYWLNPHRRTTTTVAVINPPTFEILLEMFKGNLNKVLVDMDQLEEPSRAQIIYESVERMDILIETLKALQSTLQAHPETLRLVQDNFMRLKWYIWTLNFSGPKNELEEAKALLDDSRGKDLSKFEVPTSKKFPTLGVPLTLKQLLEKCNGEIDVILSALLHQGEGNIDTLSKTISNAQEKLGILFDTVPVVHPACPEKDQDDLRETSQAIMWDISHYILPHLSQPANPDREDVVQKLVNYKNSGVYLHRVPSEPPSPYAVDANT